MSKLALFGGPKVREKPFPSWPVRDEGCKKRLAEVVDSGIWGIGGGKQAEFVRRFAEFCEASHCVACNSGTTALEIALRAAGIGPGDEVIVPPYTFIATASAAIYVGAIPVFADIDPETLTINPNAAEAAITERTAAIIAVHIAGMPCDMAALTGLARSHGLKLIEDCAQAHGAEYGGRRVGALGDAGCFSFQSSKNITAGEGGALVTNDDALYGRAWSIHNVGRVPEGGWYDHRVLGWNLRITEFQCAVLLRGLELWPDQDARRQENAARLRGHLEDIPGLRAQAFPPGATKCAYHLFPVLYDQESLDGLPLARFLEALNAEGIPAWTGYNPLYREGVFLDGLDMKGCPFACKFYTGKVDYRSLDLPNVERICRGGAFWLFHSLLLGDPSDTDDIGEAMHKVYENRAELLCR
ncbi:MAG: DegT/DnrJ/EryC1/StrS family aminotransferase [Armatimonadetes bacterium]|nr:DegT/DnrJ/EryC1/StrS family aminotransferase [Armatimonadota bacterium]